jgi:hypothetical protein
MLSGKQLETVQGSLRFPCDELTSCQAPAPSCQASAQPELACQAKNPSFDTASKQQQLSTTTSRIASKFNPPQGYDDQANEINPHHRAHCARGKKEFAQRRNFTLHPGAYQTGPDQTRPDPANRLTLALPRRKRTLHPLRTRHITSRRQRQ